MNPHLHYIDNELRRIASECDCRSEHGAEPRALIGAIGRHIYALADLVERLDESFPKEEKRFAKSRAPKKPKTLYQVFAEEAAEKENNPPF
jgi:hypothetical protein